MGQTCFSFRTLVEMERSVEGDHPVFRLAGHEDIATTLGVYGHVNYAMLQFIADKFDEVFKQDWMS